MDKTYSIGKILARGLEDEGQAIKKYSADFAELAEIALGVLSPEQINEIRAEYDEIIADELNHAAKFYNLYTRVTQIAPKED